MRKFGRRFGAMILLVVAVLMVVMILPSTSPKLTVRFRLPSLAIQGSEYGKEPLGYDLLSKGSIAVTCENPDVLHVTTHSFYQGYYDLLIQVFYHYRGHITGQTFEESFPTPNEGVDSICAMNISDWPWSVPDPPNPHYLVLLDLTYEGTLVATHTIIIDAIT